MLVCTGVHVYVRCAGVEAHACVCELCGCAGVRGCEGVCVCVDGVRRYDTADYKIDVAK